MENERNMRRNEKNIKRTKARVKKTKSVCFLEKMRFPRLMGCQEARMATAETGVRRDGEAPHGDRQNSKSNIVVSSSNFK